MDDKSEVNNRSTQENTSLLPPLASILSEKVERNTEGRRAVMGGNGSLYGGNGVVGGWIPIQFYEEFGAEDG